MSKLIIEICKINKIEKHPNADRLDIITIKGWNCIVGKDNYKVGDLVIFCPIDCVIPEDLILKYDLAYLKKDGRVKTVKLRKFISQGLILKVPKDKKYKLGQDVAKELGIIKYEPPVAGFQQKNNKLTIKKLFTKLIHNEITLRIFIAKSIGVVRYNLKPKKNPNPLFSKYTDINNIKNYPNVFREGDKVIVTEKIHGCGTYQQRIILSNGETKLLGYIVNNKIKAEILGMDKSGNVIPTKITNWFRNGITEDWIKIKFINNRGEISSATFTPNHKFYDPNLGKYRALETFKLGENILYVTETIKTEPHTIKNKIIKIEKVKKRGVKFDIETGTHNFFANGVLVHNSNFRAGYLLVYPGSGILGGFKALINKIRGNTYEFVYGSHNVQLTGRLSKKTFYGDDVYGKIAKKYDLMNKIPKDYIVYGEIYGGNVQELKYGLKDSNDLVVFDVKYKYNYLDYYDMVIFCRLRGLHTAPFLGFREYNFEEIKKLTNEGDSLLCEGHIKEGVVIRPRLECNHKKIGRLILKSVSEEYLCNKHRTEFH